MVRAINFVRVFIFYFLARSVLQSFMGIIVQNQLVKSNKFQRTCVSEKVCESKVLDIFVLITFFVL